MCSMAREAYDTAAILDADVVDRSRLTGQDQDGWAARLARHRVERFEPALARHGGRLVSPPGDGARAEFPSAAAALGAAIEFQQAMADANRDQPADTAIVFRLRLHLDDAREGRDIARRLEAQAGPQERAGGIVVSATLRDAVVGRVPASFAELGSAGLGSLAQPVRAYEVGWDPADWPAASAATAEPVTARGEGRRLGPWAGAMWIAFLLGVAWLVLAPRPQPASAGWRAPVIDGLDRVALEGRAPPSVARWQHEHGEPDEPDDEPADAGNALAADAHDGLYTGKAAMQPGGRLATFRATVTNGIGAGTVSRLDCGTAAFALSISPAGEVSGRALVFDSTCLKSELAVRGRALGGRLQLRLGSQYLELSKADD